MQSERALNTVKAYAHCWLRFANWCAEYNRQPLPATAETVYYFVGWCLDQRRDRKLRLNTVRLNLAAIKHKHRECKFPIPIDDRVKHQMRSAPRRLKERRGGKEALTVPLLERMLAQITAETNEQGVRDKAVLLFGFASGWRRSELAGLDLSNVAALSSKEITMRLGASKTDQEGEGREVKIPCGKRQSTCPVRALRAWLKIRGKWEGPLFCAVDPNHRIVRRALTGEGIALIVQRSLQKIGEDSKLYGAHSMRSGLITTGAENGANLAALQHRTGHRSLAMLLKYIRLKGASRLDPLQGVL